MPELDLLVTAEAAAELDVTAATICRWVESGDMTPAAKGRGLRGGYLFTRAEVERMRKERAS